MPSAEGLIKNGVALAVGFLVVALLVANLIPDAINETVQPDRLNESTTFPPSTWGSTETTLWELLPMAYVLGPFLFFIFAALAYARS